MPGSPLPANLIRLPSRTPAGILTRKRRTLRWAPVPLQVGHGSSITVPEPPQLEHGCVIEKIPWLCASTPRPWQTGQIFGLVPERAPLPWQVGQGCEVGTDNRTWVPRTASSKLSWTSDSRSRPRASAARWGPDRVAPPGPPPNRLERMSPKLPPKLEASKLGTPKPANAPPRSYSLRLSGSERTSCACEISLKRSSAFLSPGLRSG